MRKSLWALALAFVLILSSIQGALAQSASSGSAATANSTSNTTNNPTATGTGSAQSVLTNNSTAPRPFVNTVPGTFGTAGVFSGIPILDTDWLVYRLPFTMQLTMSEINRVKKKDRGVEISAAIIHPGSSNDEPIKFVSANYVGTPDDKLLGEIIVTGKYLKPDLYSLALGLARAKAETGTSRVLILARGLRDNITRGKSAGFGGGVGKAQSDTLAYGVSAGVMFGSNRTRVQDYPEFRIIAMNDGPTETFAQRQTPPAQPPPAPAPPPTIQQPAPQPAPAPATDRLISKLDQLVDHLTTIIVEQSRPAPTPAPQPPPAPTPAPIARPQPPAHTTVFRCHKKDVPKECCAAEPDKCPRPTVKVEVNNIIPSPPVNADQGNKCVDAIAKFSSFAVALMALCCLLIAVLAIAFFAFFRRPIMTIVSGFPGAQRRNGLAPGETYPTNMVNPGRRTVAMAARANGLRYPYTYETRTGDQFRCLGILREYDNQWPVTRFLDHPEVGDVTWMEREDTAAKLARSKGKTS